MKQYTLYQVEKLSAGALSKYKLKQAIKQGRLKATHVKHEKRGPGYPQFVIEESDLKSYLRLLEEEKKGVSDVTRYIGQVAEDYSKSELELLRERVAKLEQDGEEYRKRIDYLLKTNGVMLTS